MGQDISNRVVLATFMGMALCNVVQVHGAPTAWTKRSKKGKRAI